MGSDRIMNIRRIRIGTRGSILALAQTELVEQAIKASFPDIEFERIIYKTEADSNKRKPLVEFGGTGVFVKELERALLDGEIDIAVHSAKDMPAMISEGLCIAGTLPRDDVRDVLVYRKELGKSVDEITGSFTVGTGSPRRQSQLQELYPGFSCIGIRGNVPTRLNKVRNGECDGVILASAGLKRLGLMEQQEFSYHFFPEEEILPAGGQAIIAIEGRISDDVIPYIQAISDETAYVELMAEQKILRGLNAGCHEPIAVRARVEKDDILISVAREVVVKEDFAKSTSQMSSIKKDGDKFSLPLSNHRIDRICKKGKVSGWEMLADEIVDTLI